MDWTSDTYRLQVEADVDVSRTRCRGARNGHGVERVQIGFDQGEAAAVVRGSRVRLRCTLVTEDGLVQTIVVRLR